MFGDQDNTVADPDVVDRAPRFWPVGRRDSQGPNDEFLPGTGMAVRGSINYPAPRAAVPVDSGHDDPH